MKVKNFLMIGLLLSGATAFAQSTETVLPVTLGLKFGVPLTDNFSASNTSLFSGQQLPGSTYSSGTARYILGASAEFKLPFRLGFEVDGLYRRGGFANNLLPAGSIGNYQSTAFNDWQIPGLFKYRFSLGHFRPFVDAGAAYRHVSGITTRTYGPNIIGALYNNNAPELTNRNTFGGVAGFGLGFKVANVELTPEVRYTRWANSTFAGPGLKSNLDQGDFLLGITF